MDSKTLKQTIKEAQNSSDTMSKLIQQFSPLIRKCARILSHNLQDLEDAEQEFRITFITTIRHCPIEHFPENTDYPILAYIDHSMKNRLMRLLKQRAIPSTEVSLEDMPTDICDQSPMKPEISIEISDLLKMLTTIQRYTIIAHYYYGYSDQEIAQKLHISRQAVHKNRINALKNLKERLS